MQKPIKMPANAGIFYSHYRNAAVIGSVGSCLRTRDVW